MSKRPYLFFILTAIIFSGTLKFYLDEYSKSYISVDALVAALKELLNTQAKVFVLLSIMDLNLPTYLWLTFNNITSTLFERELQLTEL